ncbi:MAG TPA: response regulator [Hyphomicrobium sp.]|nr:response regulator [Hyphomicrobium sp.]
MATILLADDDAAVRELVKRALLAEGHTVHVTQDGNEALDVLNAHKTIIDVLISDVDMPGLDGVSLAMQAQRAKPGIAVVLMSGFSDQLERARELSQKRLKSITKPFTLDQIKQAVRAVTG